MSGDGWPEVERCFHELADLPPEAQQAALEARFAGRPELRSRVEALLARDREDTPFLDRPVVKVGKALEEGHEPPGGALAGRTVGGYRLSRPVAYGGTGTVYVATRGHDGNVEQVAVKFLHEGVDPKRLMRRFRAEQRALSHLEHPGIARLLDAGTLDAGAPYLVMEWVEGLPIDEYCDRHGLSLAQRLELFRLVCRAVHAAHRSLVVHRDLKPDNILVTADGAPKLVDFGIARLLEARGGRARAATVSRLMTPDYASPEQVRGEPVTTATDIYSLGVVLFELLAGDRPYRFEGGGPAEIERIVCLDAPPRPSTVAARAGRARRATAAARGLGPEALQRRLRGDLDNIVMMALRKEPHRRYASAAELAEDLDRYLRGLPVAARQDTVWYRTRKLILRNKLPVGIAAVLLLSLAIGTVVIGRQARLTAHQRDAAEAARVEESRQRRRAEAAEQAALAEAARAAAEAESARLVSDFLVDVFEVADPNEAPGGAVTALDVLDEASQRLRRGTDLEPAVRATLAHAVGRVSMNLGRYDRAAELLEKALAIRVAANGADGEATLETRAALGQLLYARGDYGAARRALEEVVAARRRRGEEGTVEFAQALNDLAATRKALGELEEVEPLYRRALEIRRERLGEDDPAVAESLNNLAGLFASRGDLGRAQEYLRQALRVRRKALGEAHPLTAQTLSNLATVAHMRGDLPAAEPLYREALERFREVYGEAHPAVATTASGLGAVLHAAGELADAERHLRDALALRRRRLGDDHPSNAPTLSRLALVLRDGGDLPAAREAVEEALRLRRASLPAGHTETAGTLQVYGAILLALHEHEAAEAALREALSIYRAALPARHYSVGVTEQTLGATLRAAGRLEEAEPLLRHAYEVLAAARGEDGVEASRAADELAELYERLDRPEDARAWRRR